MSGHGGRGASSLRAQIMRLRLPIDGCDRYFVPEGPLIELMTKERVQKAISDTADIETFQVGELVDIILKGAIKVFAILVLLKGEEALILRFVETDGFQKTALDARLPLHRSQIQALVPEDAVDDFYEKQWEFVVPFFSKAIIHRVMDHSARLPFVLDTDTGKEGGFGHIYEIQIHPEYHEYPLSSDGKVSILPNVPQFSLSRSGTLSIGKERILSHFQSSRRFQARNTQSQHPESNQAPKYR